MAINNVQKHIAEPGAIPLIFNDDIPSETNKDLNTLQNLPNYQEIVNRLAQLKNIYLTHRPADQLEMNFQAIRNATDLNNPQGVVHTIINTSGMFILNSLEGALVNTTNNDIIINMNNLGIGLVSVTESALIGIVVAQLVTKGNFAVAIAAKLSGVSGILGVISSVVTPFLIMGLLIGLVLQFVLPAIPLIKWLVALQSWAIMMFVAMVYAPIWMMSTAAASNEDWVNDKVRDGFIMLAELILRPLLMVFGFYAAMLLMAVANIGARIAFPYLTGLADEGILSFISVGAVLILAVFISYKLVTRTFDLIYELPDFIIERMGGRPLGDAVRDDTANSTVMIAGKFTGGIGGAAAGVAKGVTKGSQ
jgi:conjugal transfer/type IV secretion protein DotA/TraY